MKIKMTQRILIIEKENQKLQEQLDEKDEQIKLLGQ